MHKIILCRTEEGVILPPAGPLPEQDAAPSNAEAPQEENETQAGTEAPQGEDAAPSGTEVPQGENTAPSGTETQQEEDETQPDMEALMEKNGSSRGKEVSEMIQKQELKDNVVMTGSAAVLLVLLTVIMTLLVQRLIKMKRRPKGYMVQPTEPTVSDPVLLRTEGQPIKTDSGKIGKVHNIGKRSTQQDSFGVADTYGGVLAVVADGMGGLSDGDKVSQKIVLTMLQEAVQLRPGYKEGSPLYPMISNANKEVLRMCEGLDSSRSGSTVVAVLTEKDSFHWISVGDSRIYLFRNNQLIQINSDHIYERELLQRAVNREMSFSEVQADKQRKRVTSFIGMGKLKHIEGSLCPVKIQSGDKVLLMTDGVFHTLPEQEICKVLAESENAEKAAVIMEQHILAKQNPKQDNFTMVILDFQV